MRRVSLALAVAALVAAPYFPGAPAGPIAGAATSGPPGCVVSLSPTATETLYAIGAGRQVQAVDTDSNYPVHGLPTKRINALNPSVEALISVCTPTKAHPSTKPDLVVISYNANDVAQKLTGFGVKVVTQGAPTTLAGAYDQMVALGELTGHARAARRIVAGIKRQVAADLASVPAHPAKKLTVYYELDPTYYSLTSATFVGSLLQSLGASNVADAKNTSADAGYPQLSAEYVIRADPKLIFLADTVCCHQSRATLAKRAGFAGVSAVAHHHVVALNDDVASRWGPRLGTLMGELTAGVKAALADPSLWPTG
jgi:cobalamin transport system substrate-binding protein